MELSNRSALALPVIFGMRPVQWISNKGCAQKAENFKLLISLMYCSSVAFFFWGGVIWRYNTVREIGGRLSTIIHKDKLFLLD